MKNGTLEYRDKASTDDLKLQLEKIGEKKDNIRRAVTISVKHYEVLVKGTLQIPLKYFKSYPKVNGEAESSTACPAAAVTQSEQPKVKMSSRIKSSSFSNPKPANLESSTTRHAAVATQSGRHGNSSQHSDNHSSSSRSICPTSPCHSPPRHRERSPARQARTGMTGTGS